MQALSSALHFHATSFFFFMVLELYTPTEARARLWFSEVLSLRKSLEPHQRSQTIRSR